MIGLVTGGGGGGGGEGGKSNFKVSTRIHPKSWMEKSTDYLEFSTEGLSGNTTTIKFALSGEFTLQFHPDYVQTLPKSLIKTYQHINTVCFHKKSLQTNFFCDFDNLCTFWRKILASRLTQFFSQIFFGLRGKIRRPFHF